MSLPRALPTPTRCAAFLRRLSPAPVIATVLALRLRRAGARALAALATLAMLAACGGGGGSGGLIGAPPIQNPSAPTLSLGLQSVASGLAAPTFLSAPPGDARLFIVERAGRIRIVDQGVLLALPFLDISALTTTDGEHGLLSLAFDPAYASNGYFYVYYTDLAGNLIIARYTAPIPSGNSADSLSRLTILSIAHPTYNNHNGGQLAFGADGYLYIGTGDGGGAGDPSGNAQNTASLLGKLLRINVAGANAAVPYTIPATNPFSATGTRRAEIWALGLRNPWRFSFDTPSGNLYIADVGQGAFEEVDVAPLSAGALNYGWNIMEAMQCYNAASCATQGLTLPVLQYDHSGGNCAITGGYVYRGQALPELTGRYFYADLCSGAVSSFLLVNGIATEKTNWALPNVTPVYSFGLDGRNELYLISGAGTVYRLVRQ